MCQIIAFGDSITFGFWDREGGWIARLRKWIDNKNLEFSRFYYRVYNLGIDGNTTQDLLIRTDKEISQRIEEDTKTLILFAIGINDSEYYNTEKKLVTSPEKFQQNIKELIFMAKKYTNNIVFLEAIGVDETKVDPIPWARDRSYKNIYIKKYNGIIKKECQKNKVHFIEIFDYWVKSDYKNWLEDGVHPNSMGHKKIFEKVREFLISKKLI